MLRFSALLCVGALAVHQVRYLLGGSAPGGPSHAYLGPVGSLVAGVLVLALARAALGRAGRVPRLRVLWPCATAALIAVYCLQETAEGTSPVGHGGWLAFPLALLAGLAVALLMRAVNRASVDGPRPWRPPLPVARAALASVALPLQARSGAPRLLPARGPPSHVGTT